MTYNAAIQFQEDIRRARDISFPPLSDDDLVADAEALFLNLNQRKLTDEHSE